MTDLRTAAQQALEALEFLSLDFFMLDPISPGREASNKAITALRAALAQQAEPVEPVAWIQPDHLQKARVAPFLCRVEPTQRCVDFVPLYTAPPQRKPLTQEEIAAEWRKASECAGKSEGAVTTSQFVEMFARAVEAKHGIKESP